jgi:hypothetical protein
MEARALIDRTEGNMTGRLKPTSPQARASLFMAATVAALVTGCGSSSNQSSSTTPGSTPSPSALAPIQGAYAPKIDPADFVAVADNRYFPLVPGTAFHYKGVAEDGKTPQTDDMVVTRQTKMILGVRCTVVRDTVSSKGKPIEHTFDWYAQDREGNVWYMGEDTRELQHGKFVQADDSWEGGVAGAEPGIIMPGNPQRGDAYRQEYYPRFAMDQARVLGPGGPVTVPSGSYKNTLLTVETAPQVDPGVAERKWYVAGLGEIKEHVVSGNHEEIVLVSVTHS